MPPGMGTPGPAADPVAIVSLVLGIASIPLHFCCYLGWPVGIGAIVCGIIALSRISGSQGQKTGKGMAIGGIVATVFGFVMIIGIFILYGAAIAIASV